MQIKTKINKTLQNIKKRSGQNGQTPTNFPKRIRDKPRNQYSLKTVIDKNQEQLDKKLKEGSWDMAHKLHLNCVI